MTVCLFLIMAALLLRWAFKEEPIGSKSESVARVNSVAIDQVDSAAINQTNSYGDEGNDNASEAGSSSGTVREQAGNRGAQELEFAQMPLVFYQPSADAGWSEEQLDRMVALREMFAAALGGLEQDPTNPSYRERWIRAQPWIDEQFQTIFGDEAFGKQQLQAVHHLNP